MGLVPPAVETPPAAEGQASTARDRARWLVLSGYLLAAVALTWRLWADPAGRAQAGDPHDVDLFVWYMHYAAAAIAHGRLPALVTTAMNAPTGVSVMWNTSLLLPGMLLTPVTLLAGPQASLTVLLTLGFAGSAASLFWVLRRWGASTSAAALGGAVYGFSPALVNAGIGHYHLVLAVTPPLIIDALLRIVTGRGHPAGRPRAGGGAGRRPSARGGRPGPCRRARALGVHRGRAGDLRLCPLGAAGRAAAGAHRSGVLVGHQPRVLRGPGWHHAHPHVRGRGRRQRFSPGRPRGPGVSRLAAHRRARGRRDPVLARAEGPRRGRDVRRAGPVQPRRRRPAVLSGLAAAVALPPGPAGARSGAAEPVLDPRRRRRGRRGSVRAGPGALGHSAGTGLATESDSGHGRGPGGAAADPAALSGGRGQAGARGVAGRVRPPAAPARRPRARGPDPERGSHLCHALAGGHGRARLTDRRLLPRTRQYRGGHVRPRPGQVDRQVPGFPVGRHTPRDRLVRRADPSCPRVLAARRRGRGGPAPGARPRPDRPVRQTHPPRR